MRYDRKVAIVLLFAATLALLSTSLYITPTTISDRDPSTYVIVPILMLPLFLLFSMKSKPEPVVGRRDIAIGCVALAIFACLFIALRFYFSFFFIGYRLDLLLMPFPIAALVVLLFGVQNLQRFRGALLYTLLSSPLVLYPILAQFDAFVQFNSRLIYDMLNLFIGKLSYVPPITIAYGPTAISIGQACVSLGIFVALPLFLIPIAYLYDGSVRRKFLWVASGAALLFIFNLIRMFAISLVWLKYGPNATALYIHQFIGVLLFYLAIVVMILMARFYGLGMPKAGKRVRRSPHKSGLPLPSLVALLAFCLFYVFLTLNYSTVLSISPLILSNKAPFNYTNTQIATQISSQIGRNNFTSFLFATHNGTSVLFTLVNGTINGTNPLLLYYSSPSSNTIVGIQSQNEVLGQTSFLNRFGAKEQVFDVFSNNTEFGVYYTNVPFVLSNMSVSVAGAYLIAPIRVLPSVYSCSGYDQFYSGVAGAFTSSIPNETVRRHLLATECLADRIVWA